MVKIKFVIHYVTVLLFAIQPGFEIVEVDGVRVKGMTHGEAARTLAQAFSTEQPTIELAIIPK